MNSGNEWLNGQQARLDDRGIGRLPLCESTRNKVLPIPRRRMQVYSRCVHRVVHCALRRAPGAKPVGIDPGEFSTDQEHLRRGVDPQQHRDQGPCGAEGRGDAAATDIAADRDLPSVKSSAVNSAPIHTSRHNTRTPDITL